VYVAFVILAYLENGRLERTACLHQILLKRGENATETIKILKVAFGEQTEGRTEVFECFS
jgi:hypothetical protein